MIISHKNQYLFVELEHTASTAIRNELCLNYDGESILRKHARYHEFLKTAAPEEQNYFVFSGIRNPLDVAVTVYFKLKTNHNGQYTNPKMLRANGGHVSKAAIRKFQFLKETDADFPTFFKRYHRSVFHNTSILYHQNFDSIIRYENLQDDFARTLGKIGLELKRELPLVNKTDGKKSDFLTYYTPEIYRQAGSTLGPFMQLWGYQFPSSWGAVKIPWTSRLRFRAICFLKSIYWQYLKKQSI